ncbi:angiotensin-converting enzyme [Trichonephila inaurata madagascariensis]|uniref:Angiotensin-converting enzyme n=1 Tax=Trichonephila inaurata madagascariensis TaxID=2747483 RepID=A0A8X6XXL2_9ARAC|nr:angiotensin-converting enzyme [Trichonephila inaurata madagascariensis]
MLWRSMNITVNVVHENVTERLQQFDKEFQSMWWLHQSADWNYSTNVSKATASSRKFASVAYSNWMREWKLWARELRDVDLPFPEQQQVITMLAAGVIFLNPEDTRLIIELKSKLTEVYSTAKITLPEFNITAQGENEVISLVAKIRDPDVLKEIWKSWRLQIGEKSKSDWFQLVQLTNKEAEKNGYSDVGEAWREELGLEDVISTVLSLWDEVKDFYKELQSYVKYKLRAHFGAKHFGKNPWIPAHLLVKYTQNILNTVFHWIHGSLWGDNWSALSDILIPYTQKRFVNITSEMLLNGYSVTDLLRKAEEFYTAMGLNPMRSDFWAKSMFVKPTDGRFVDCHAVSYDFALNEDYRIRMCAEVREHSLLEAIHEMGHIHYYMGYHKLPMIYRSGANSAFHEAVGETMVYAAQSPKCLHTLNLRSSDTSGEILVNTLMKQALSKFVLLPWALTVEMWRYRLFSGEIKEKDMMRKWWELRKKSLPVPLQTDNNLSLTLFFPWPSIFQRIGFVIPITKNGKMIQGIEPPDLESSELFDPGSKYHVVLHIPYMRYFLSRFLEHQFLEALCKTANEELHSCCFITCQKAGDKLKHMLSLGASVSWKDALEVLTGERKISAKSLLNYYSPLHHWLIEYNRNHNISITW